MNNAVIKTIVISAVIALIGYIVLSQLIPLSIDNALAFALGAFITGLIIATTTPASATAHSNQDTKTLYVGNLPYRANEKAVKELFAGYGHVHSVRLLKDRQTGKRRGFGFVEMAACDADNAINKLNDNEFMERTLKVREAKNQPKEAEA